MIARAVPLSLIWKINTSPIDAVPVRLVVIDVMAAANAVMFTISQLFVLIVGVPDDVIVVTRGVIRLFVSVSVVDGPETATHDPPAARYLFAAASPAAGAGTMPLTPPAPLSPVNATPDTTGLLGSVLSILTPSPELVVMLSNMVSTSPLKPIGT